MREHTAPEAARARRIGGVDLARATAIIGMFMVHVGPMNVPDLAGRLYQLPHGRASILFVLVAGLGVALLASSRSRSISSARWRLAWRAALLLPLGLLLQELRHGVLVILQTYGLLFLLAILALRFSKRLLLALAAALALLGPLTFLIGRMLDPGTFNRSATHWSDTLASILHGLALSGPYPILVWSAPFLLGMWIGRHDLRSASVRAGLIVYGAVVAVLGLALSGVLEALLGSAGAIASWRDLFVAAPHSQMPLWIVSASGSAAALLGLALVLADALPRAIWPLVAMGQLALTVYVAHLLVLHGYSDVLRSREVGEAVRSVLLLAGGGALLAVAWRAVLPRGPLEMLLDVPWRVTAGRGGTRGRATAPKAGLPAEQESRPGRES